MTRVIILELYNRLAVKAGRRLVGRGYAVAVLASIDIVVSYARPNWHFFVRGEHELSCLAFWKTSADAFVPISKAESSRLRRELNSTGPAGISFRS
jgi:hypothetical protein